jgi:DNA-binding beta-propeller fold protein YncE
VISSVARLFAVTGLVLSGAPALFAGPPLAQLPGTQACVSDTGSAGACVDGRALNQPAGVAVSPDSRTVYVASQFSNAVAIFTRNPATGALTQKGGQTGCIADLGADGCALGFRLQSAMEVTVSPEGRTVYVGTGTGVLNGFNRSQGGEISQISGSSGCVSTDGSGGQCLTAPTLGPVRAVAVSPDGRNVYFSTGLTDAVTVFDREPGGGLVLKTGTDACVAETDLSGTCADGIALDGASGLAVSPDGLHLYVASLFSDAVAVFDRNPSTGVLVQKAGLDGCISETGAGPCADGKALDQPTAMDLSPDGRTLYVISTESDSIAVFDRDPSTGVLTQKPGTAGCASHTGSGGDCALSPPLNLPVDVLVSGDGASVYVVALSDDALTIFARDRMTGALARKAGTGGCLSDTGTAGTCYDATAFAGTIAATESSDGRSVYILAADSDAVTAFERGAPAYDVDGDGSFDALTDGLLLLRYFFGFRGATLVSGAVDLVSCTRCTAVEVEEFIAGQAPD